MPVELRGLSVCDRCKHGEEPGCLLLHRELVAMLERLSREAVKKQVRLPSATIYVDMPCRTPMHYSTEF